MSTATESAHRPGGPDGAESSPGPGDPSAARDAFFDNAKYLAILLVAVGHIWEPLLPDDRGLLALYVFVYSFHMPAFIVISGFFSRSFDASPGRVRRLVTCFVVPYVLFETAYALFTRWSDDDPQRPITLLDPTYVTWFLAALFVWRLTAPLWRSLRWPLAVALVVAMLASLSPSIGEDLDLQRVLQFLPYFVLGLCLRPDHFALVRHPAVRVLSVPVALLCLAAAYWAVPRVSYAWLYHSSAAQQLGMSWWAGPVVTLLLFAVGVTLVACFLAWVPARRTWFTALGAGTLYGYLLHGFFMKTLARTGFHDLLRPHGLPGLLAVTLLGALVVTALCTAPVRRLFRPVVEPRTRWAFRAPRETAPG
ncbi:acyltransferase family protein [Streptomyces sp. UH6]|uniref:acyltransferase family protein n=1 Tax=Streptomyces sp. UH6 TaxID=2748379 RepID=UPI0015D4F632|nr:acyltransferase family protein [Streptomyces sp. UH6]NYV77087.1 acyltransferase family protein [Streptomyces sp. UH6]